MKLNVVCRNDKYLPSYANTTDACMDLKARVVTGGTVLLHPKETVILGSGLQVAIPENHVMLIFPRSSTGIKKNCMLANSVGVIDTGYRDEIKIALHNFGKEVIEISDGDRVAQFMIIPRPTIEALNIVSDDDAFRNGDRGGGIGSTGK